MRKFIPAVLFVTFLMLMPGIGYPAVSDDVQITPAELAATPQYEKPDDPAAARGLEQVLGKLNAALQEIAELDILKKAEAAKEPAGVVRTYAEVREKSRNAIFIVTYPTHSQQLDIQKVFFKDFERRVEDRSQGYRIYLDRAMIFYQGLGKSMGSVGVSRPKMMPSHYGWQISEDPLTYYQFMWDKEGKKTRESRTESKKIREVAYVHASDNPLQKISQTNFTCERPVDPTAAANFDRMINRLKMACAEFDQKLATGKAMLRPSPSSGYYIELESENGRERYSYSFTDASGNTFRQVRKDVFRYAGTDVYEKAGFIIDFQENGTDAKNFSDKASKKYSLAFYPGMRPSSFSFQLEATNEAAGNYSVRWDETGKITRQGKWGVSNQKLLNPAP